MAKAFESVAWVVTDIRPEAALVEATRLAGIALVSFEYVIQCIINQRVLPPDLHRKFHYGYVPSNVRKNSAV